MSDARAKAVIKKLADLAKRTNYIIDRATNLREPLALNESIDVPSLGDLTVTESGATDTDAQTPSPNVINLVADKDPAIFVQLPALQSIQNLEGAWAANVGDQSMIQLKNKMDTDWTKYLALDRCWTTGTSAALHDNVEGDALTAVDILNARAALLDQGGANPQGLELYVNPYGEGAVMAIPGFIPNFTQAEAGNLGIAQLGSVFGVKVFSSQSVPRRRSIASSQSVGATTYITITVPSGHGVVAGMKGTFTSGTGTHDVTSAAVVISTTATTIVLTKGSAGTATLSEVGAFVVESCENVMVDASHLYVAQQKMPNARVVQDPDTTGDVLQVFSIWGRVARIGRARTLHSPPTVTAAA